MVNPMQQRSGVASLFRSLSKTRRRTSQLPGEWQRRTPEIERDESAPTWLTSSPVPLRTLDPLQGRGRSLMERLIVGIRALLGDKE